MSFHHFRRALRPALVITALSVVVSVIVASAIQYLAGQELNGVHFGLAFGMPLFMSLVTILPFTVMNARLHAAHQQLQKQARTDPLTGLPNRRDFFERARAMFAAADRGGEPVVAMMIDIDRFKSVNDLHGHDAGDLVLRETGRALQEGLAAQICAQETILARIGGEEFAAMIRGASLECAAKLAQSMCQRVRDTVFVSHGAQIAVTVSIGFAMRLPGAGIDCVMQAADKAVYAAKQGGRDCWREAAATDPGCARAA